MHLVHEVRVVAGHEERRVVGNCPEERVEPIPIVFGEVMQHMSVNEFLRAWMADADADATIILAEMRVDGLQSLVAAVPAACFHAELARREIEFVMDDNDVAGLQLVE